jgi:acetoin utilization deacetylase AcuC-like enzyme
MKTKIIYSERCLEYGGIASPENANRIDTAARILEESGAEFIEPQAARDAEILLVHNKQYVQGVKKGTIADPDTPAWNNIFGYAKLAAGAAILAAKTNGFSLMRPPGHHCGIAGRALGASTRGFCYFNNIAVAVRALNKKTVIIDIDGHHGNGTQEIFLGDKKIIYISFHQNAVYPGTGAESQDNCHNFPLEANCGPEIYLKTLRLALKECADKINDCEVIAIDAGFDTHWGDLVSLGLDSDDFLKIGKLIGKLNKPTFSVLEGGYNGQNLGNDVVAFLEGIEN